MDKKLPLYSDNSINATFLRIFITNVEELKSCRTIISHVISLQSFLSLSLSLTLSLFLFFCFWRYINLRYFWYFIKPLFDYY